MAAIGPFYAHKETRLNLDPATPGSTVAITLPAHGATTWASRKAQKRSHVAEVPIAEDETAFRKNHLAISASIYHRQHHKSPRSFLWRVLEGGKVLSIRAVDVSRQTNAPDANLTLRLTFPSVITPGCIAFSDSREHDVLNVFVVTESRQLYALNLRPDYFRKPSSTEDNVRDWCKISVPSSFAIGHPHRLVALSADELLISSPNGELQKLTRKSADGKYNTSEEVAECLHSLGSEWDVAHYNDRSFRQNIRSWIPLHGSNTIRYDKGTIDLSTATSIASSYTIIDGMPYAFTVSLDHQLRVWNLQTRKVAYMGDILDQEPGSKETSKRVIDPSHSQLVKVYGEDEGALCVTYSPLGNGQFKFWSIQSAEDGNLAVTDLFPENTLEPQAPTSDLWTLADFSVVQDRTNTEGFTIWTLWKNNTTYRIQKLDFRSASPARVRDAWSQGWTAMAAETLRETPLPTVFQGDPSDGTDKWLEFILTPGRFTEATVETGLAIYEGGLGTKDLTRKSGTLAERMCSSIASTVSLGRASDRSMDFEQFRAATDAQWRRFYRLLIELDKQRGEAMSLVIDPQGEMPWVVLADGLTAVRDCSALEQIWHNPEMAPSGTEHVTALVIAAAALRESLPDQFHHSCNAAVLGELFEEPSLIDQARMRAFYDKCDFANHIGDEEYNQLLANLGGGFKDVTPQIYEDLLELMSASEDIDKRPHLLPLAEFGNKLIVKGVQEIIELHRNICLDQLVLLVLIEAEVNHTEDGIQFETGAVFRQLIMMLQRLELISWLAKTQISLPLARERSNSISEKSSSLTKKPIPSTETITVLEGVLRHLFGLDTRSDESMSSALTEVIIQICAPDSEYEAPPAVIQCFLLKYGRADLAIEFSRFAANDAFSTYVQGRACLASNDASTASMLFKKAAFGIGLSTLSQLNAAVLTISSKPRSRKTY
jgi:nuclear pore complex protein Nup160